MAEGIPITVLAYAAGWCLERNSVAFRNDRTPRSLPNAGCLSVTSISSSRSDYSRISFVSAETLAIASLFSSPLVKPWLTLTLPSTHIITVTSALGLIL